ncbi:MAG: glycerol-3-phosphate dehydrogenase subunit GlpB [Spirochaetota bacterium]
MKFDTLIIGGGLSGLTCGIKLSQAGKKVAVVSGGVNSQNFASGSIDLFGFRPDGSISENPFDDIEALIRSDTEKKHPYSKIGISTIRESLDFIVKNAQEHGLPLYSTENKNHYKITPLGTTRPTYLSQKSVYHEKLAGAFHNVSHIAILGFDGYRDFYPALMIPNLKRNPRASDKTITSGYITLPTYDESNEHPYEFRSVDIARVFEKEENIKKAADAIIAAAPDAQMVGLPAFIGIWDYDKTYEMLCSLTGKIIFEIPTPPPSLPGMRLDEALKSSYMDAGMYMAGDSVEAGLIHDDKVLFVITESNRKVKLEADTFVLASGSFLGGGLASTFDEGVFEPVFNLAVDADSSRRDWYSDRFFSKDSHPFLSYGVATDSSFRARSAEGKTVSNLFCAGAVLSGYNPIKEGSGGGVAIATGYAVAQRILKG